MKKFDIEKYLKNPKQRVVTRDGKNVRIVCTDMIGTPYPILVVCRVDATHDCYYSYTLNGKYNLDVESCLDLFFAPEKKEGWLNLYKNENGRVAIGTVYPIESEENAKKIASADKEYVATCKITWEE